MEDVTAHLSEGKSRDDLLRSFFIAMGYDSEIPQFIDSSSHHLAFLFYSNFCQLTLF